MMAAIASQRVAMDHYLMEFQTSSAKMEPALRFAILLLTMSGSVGSSWRRSSNLLVGLTSVATQSTSQLTGSHFPLCRRSTAFLVMFGCDVQMHGMFVGFYTACSRFVDMRPLSTWVRLCHVSILSWAKSVL